MNRNIFRRSNIFLVVLVTALGFFCETAVAVDVKILHPPYIELGPGTPPENVFPIVCYLIGMRADVFIAWGNEEYRAEEAAKGENKTQAGSATERYKDGLVLPQYQGYLVIDESFGLTYYGKFPNDGINHWIQETNKKSTVFEYGSKVAPRWSWNGVNLLMQDLAFFRYVPAMVCTFGVPPDPDWVPQIKRTGRIQVQDIPKASFAIAKRSPESMLDATVTNMKPGMVFKTIYKDFLFP